jgi:hypothetical protein
MSPSNSSYPQFGAQTNPYPLGGFSPYHYPSGSGAGNGGLAMWPTSKPNTIAPGVNHNGNPLGNGASGPGAGQGAGGIFGGANAAAGAAGLEGEKMCELIITGPGDTVDAARLRLLVMLDELVSCSLLQLASDSLRGASILVFLIRGLEEQKEFPLFACLTEPYHPILSHFQRKL